MGTLTYKAFLAQIDFDWADLSYVGQVVNTDDAIGFYGVTVEEAEQDFHEAVDAYLAVCQGTRRGPDEAASLPRLACA